MKITSWDFDVFALMEITEAPLTTIMMYLYSTFHFAKRCKIPELEFYNFISIIEQNYNDNPYHNKIHAADVIQTIIYFIAQT